MLYQQLWFSNYFYTHTSKLICIYSSSGQVHALTGSFAPRSSKKSYGNFFHYFTVYISQKISFRKIKLPLYWWYKVLSTNEWFFSPSELVALDTEYIDPELIHADSPNIPPPDIPTSMVAPPSSNAHATLTQVQSMPSVLSDRQGIPISRTPTDDPPVRETPASYSHCVIILLQWNVVVYLLLYSRFIILNIPIHFTVVFIFQHCLGKAVYSLNFFKYIFTRAETKIAP